MHHQIKSFFIKACLVLLSIFFVTCDKGVEPMGPLSDKTWNNTVVNTPPNLDTIQWLNGAMHMIVEPSRLLAAYGDTAHVTVIAYDNNHNPIVNRSVTFWASVGLIRPATTTTDENGAASAKFISVPNNTEALVVANLSLTKDSIVQRSQNITLSGLTVKVRPQTGNVLLNNVVPVNIDVTDAAGKPVSGDTLFLSGSASGTLITLGNGTATTTVTRSTVGSAQIIARSSLHAVDTATVHFWTAIPESVVNHQDQIRQMRIFASRSQLNADNSDYASITVILINANNNPAIGDTIFFTSDIGVIDRSAVIDSMGRATVRLQSSPINGVCTIHATASSTKDTVSTQVLFGGISLVLTAVPAYLKTGAYATVEALLRNASNLAIGGDVVTFTVSGGALFEDGSSLARKDLEPGGESKCPSNVPGFRRLNHLCNNA